jgi:hypothetical protein
MAAASRESKNKRMGRHRKARDTARVVRWLEAGAVATGIGAAVINGQGVAWASTDADGTSANPANGSNQANDTTNTDQGTEQNPTDPTDPSNDSQPVATDNSTDADDADLDTDIDIDIDIDTDTDPSTDTDLDTETDTDPALESKPGLNDDDPELHQDQSNRRIVNNRTVQQASPELTTNSQPAITPGDSADAQRPAITTFSAAKTAVATTQAESTTLLRPPTASVAVTTVTPTHTTELRPIRQLVIGVLGIFGFSPNPAPGSPTPNPLLEAVWAMYRRVESTFWNDTPTVKAVSVTNTELTDEGDVIVSGTIDFDDYDDDPLTYTSTDGAHGSVTVNADGTFTYTPTDPATHSPSPPATRVPTCTACSACSPQAAGTPEPRR